MFQISNGSTTDLEKVTHTLNELQNDGFTETEAKLGLILTISLFGPLVRNLFSLSEEEFIETVRGCIVKTQQSPIRDFCPHS